MKRLVASAWGLLCRLRGYHRDCDGLGYAENGVYVIERRCRCGEHSPLRITLSRPRAVIPYDRYWSAR